MVDFRRCITALAVLALFAGFAVAQTPISNPLQCATNVTVPTQLRAEGFTELTGDITLNCTGGNPAAGAIPQVTITVNYNFPVTSRLIGSSNASEALLLIDEPGSTLTPVVAGFGPAAPQNLCLTPLLGCAEFSVLAANPSPGVTPPIFVATDTVNGTTPGRNAFQGVVNGSQVIFFGIPILAPGTTATRVLRITNVRVNPTALSGSASGTATVQAGISVSGASSISITSPNPLVGSVFQGLTATANSTAFNQCASVTKASDSTLAFKEGFGSAFKTRVAAQENIANAGQNASPGTSPFSRQNIPGGIFNSESGFLLPIGTATAGLADFGTRLKATFNNIPAGVRVFVSTANVNNNALPVTPPVPVGGSGGNLGSTGFAVLVNGETTPDGNAGTAGFFPAVTAIDNGPNNGNVPIAEILIDPTSHAGTAVWEVVNTNPNTVETFNFGVYVTVTSAVASNSPAPGTSTVSLSFAPTPPAVGTAAAAGLPSATSPIPRFLADVAPISGTGSRSIFVINICRTVLLYPFVTNQAGFDTGIAIANTSVDPLGTGGVSLTASQTGTCSLSWFGGTATAPTTNPAPTPPVNVLPGTVYVNTAQALVPGFQGYMFAVCNFQYAHGFAFISDVGAQKLAMGYLAIVIPDPGTGTRTATPPCQGITGCTTTGEQGGH